MSEKIEFAIFCIENIAEYLHKDPSVVYDDISGKSKILFTYIIPNYEILHTQSKEYIIHDIVDVMKEKGVCA